MLHNTFCDRLTNLQFIQSQSKSELNETIRILQPPRPGQLASLTLEPTDGSTVSRTLAWAISEHETLPSESLVLRSTVDQPHPPRLNTVEVAHCP